MPPRCLSNINSIEPYPRCLHSALSIKLLMQCKTKCNTVLAFETNYLEYESNNTIVTNNNNLRKGGWAYIAVMLEKTQATPCHSSKHGSPPTGFHPWSGGDARETYRLFIAATVAITHSKTCKIFNQVRLTINFQRKTSMAMQRKHCRRYYVVAKIQTLHNKK